jgi:CRP-like cAMP-binding protein
METPEPFLTYLQRFEKITEDEFRSLLMPVIKVRKYAKKQIITHAGEVENYFNFILKGLIRQYYVKGKEQINTQISYEGHFILCLESFHSRQPSEYFLEAIEPTTVVSISHADLEHVFASSRKLEHAGRLILTNAYVIKDKWHMQLLKLSPRERFLNFVTSFPSLMQRVPQKFLASYLNIKPETFSRFKHMIKTHSRKNAPSL